MNKKIQAIAYLFSILTSCAFGQNSPSKINMGYFYQPGQEMRVDKMYGADNTIRFLYTYKNPKALVAYLVTWKDSEARNPSNSYMLKSLCNDQNCIVSINQDSLIMGAYNALVIQEPSAQAEYLVPILENNRYTSPVILVNEANDWVADRSVKQGGRYTIQALDNKAIIYGYYYKQGFEPADPPVSIVNVPKARMQIDSTFSVISHTTIAFKSPGLYLFQTDTLSSQAFTIRVHDGNYPNLKYVNELVDPMVYISTAAEKRKIKSEMTKAQFEKLWIDMAGTEVNAKAGIKYFYRGINNSNLLFGSYKEGWKTDKGLIYTIFGPPKRVFMNGFDEIWEYDKTTNHDALGFTFLYRPTIFSIYHSILRRNSAYSIPWNRTIDRLRRGTPNYE